LFFQRTIAFEPFCFKIKQVIQPMTENLRDEGDWSSVFAFDRKAIKKQAKKELSVNYWRNVFIAAITFITVTGLMNQLLVRLANLGSNTVLADFSNWTLMKYIIHFYNAGFLASGTSLDSFLDLLLAIVFNAMTSQISFPFYVAYSVYKEGFQTATQVFYVLFGSLIYFSFILFLIHPIHVGAKKYFLEREEQGKAGTSTVLGGFNRFYINIVITKFLKSFYTFLWSLTLVGAPMAYYRYWFVDYILADNPSINPQEAILLSKKMTQGRKWAMFVNDLSFGGYALLSLASLGIFGLFFLNPYYEITYAKIYQDSKSDLLVRDPESYRKLLGVMDYNSKSLIMRRNVDYDCPYEVVDYILMFFIISFIGWIWEVGYAFLQNFTFTNRGSFYGPILPIYGSGGIVVLILLKKTRKVPWLSFLLAIAICLTIEYVTGWYLEKTTGHKYWDYSMMPFNLQGRICLYGGLAFGIGCLFVIYFIGPALYAMLSRIPDKVKWPVAGLFVAGFICDIVVSHFYPNLSGQVDSVALTMLSYFRGEVGQ
jgi:uncharacterized membrane protein